MKGTALQVRVHSLGSQPAPASTVALLERGRVLASTAVPGIDAPLDLSPKYADVTLSMPAGIKLQVCSVVLDPEGKLDEVTRMNNRVDLSDIIVATGHTEDVRSGDQVLSLREPPRPEHICLNVLDPSAVAKWYTDHLGMKIMRRSAPPSRTLFIGDSAGNMTLELTGNANAPTIDFSAINHQSMHLAFMVDDVKVMRDSLIAAGAKLVVDVTATPAGDQVLMLRDPWGLPIQFVKRVDQMLKWTGLRFEHLALNVPDPQSVTNWYLENLGMKVLRQGGAPGYTCFVADGGRHMMLEIGANNAAPFLESSKWSNLAFHFAFVVDDVRAIRTGLIEAGATLLEDIRQTSTGDEVLVLRDPWGFPIQFIKRGELLLK